VGLRRRRALTAIGPAFKGGAPPEDSKVPLHKWFQAAHLMASSKKGISSHQLHRTLGVTYKTAWFMSHRLRDAMTTINVGQIGGSGKIVESDETFIGKKKGFEKGPGAAHKMVVHSLIERGGQVRSTVLTAFSGYQVEQALKKHVSLESRLMTDEASVYRLIGREFAEHGTVEHSAGEYVKGDAHTNTLEGYFSIFKRGMKGIYQHCGEKHLHRYVAEFDFRYNNRSSLGVHDAARTTQALAGIVGKRLTHKWPDKRTAARTP
jgi:hypothetical protein